MLPREAQCHAGCSELTFIIGARWLISYHVLYRVWSQPSCHSSAPAARLNSSVRRGATNMDVNANLPVLLPLACAWVEEQSRFICKHGEPITESEFALARTVGVTRPEYIRILLVPAIPVPEDALLRAACAQLNFLGPSTEALTLSYGIYLRSGSELDRRLLAHEFRHVSQYESHPSIASYLSIYVKQLLEYGYDEAPFELDAEGAANRCAFPGDSRQE